MTVGGWQSFSNRTYGGRNVGPVRDVLPLDHPASIAVAILFAVVIAIGLYVVWSAIKPDAPPVKPASNGATGALARWERRAALTLGIGSVVGAIAFILIMLMET